jgi:hypothetical protein
LKGAVALFVAVLAAVGTFAIPATSQAATPAPLEGVPHFDHVFTIVLENENYDATWNTPIAGKATYLQTLRAKGAFADEYYGISHVSADNYIAMTSGQPATPLFNTDCVNWGACEAFEKLWPNTADPGAGARSIADQVEDAGHTWKAYMDSMGTPCKHGPQLGSDPYQSGYATRHNPFVYYPSIVENATRCNSHVVDYSHLATDLQKESTTPNYAYITPDTCHDGHDAPCVAPEAGQPGGLISANQWLSTEVPKILNSPAFHTTGKSSVLMITFDENGFSDVQGCCGLLSGTIGPNSATSALAVGGRIGLVAVGTGIKPGKVVHTTYDHWSYLRTVEDALGIGEHLNVSGLPTTPAMVDVVTP